MMKIRRYRDKDATIVGKLIADTYSKYNLSFVSAEELGLFLGPFRHAGSPNETHQKAIAEVIRSEIVFVAEVDGEIVGVLRGRIDRIASLFVRGDHHRRGIGSRLVKRFETECLAQNATVLRVSATLMGIPFYQALGYKKSTGIRSGYSFDGSGLPVQPMRKNLDRPND